ncbi:TraB/GumN family protein [Pseudidiomarina sp.]|uniref:TraB/GumN family protein n=1 Tax=Pseudidiomarina sp. TaxID=2081707 RepID=UPI003A97381D
MRYLLVVALSLYFAVLTPAQANIFFKVSHPEQQPTSYLFGTMHMVCGVDIATPKPVLNAFERSQQLVVEVNLAEPEQQLALQQNVLQHPADYLEQALSNAQYLQLKSLVEEELNLPFQQVSAIRPVFLSALFLQNYLECATAPLRLDEFFTVQANRTEKMIVGLESVVDQISLFDAIPLDLQVTALFELATEPNQSKQSLQQLEQAYLTGNGHEVYQLIQDQDDFGDYQYGLLDHRNVQWFEKLPKLLASQSTFIAVGAGHLGGSNGLVALLENAGYTVTPIPVSFVNQD